MLKLLYSALIDLKFKRSIIYFIFSGQITTLKYIILKGFSVN